MNVNEVNNNKKSTYSLRKLSRKI